MHQLNPRRPQNQRLHFLLDWPHVSSQSRPPALFQRPIHHTTTTTTTRSDGTRETVDVNALPPKPRAPANVMPGGTAHTAGGEKSSDGGPSYIDAVRSLGPEYYLNFHKRPCVRDSQLQGLAAGFAGGSLAAIIGSTSNWNMFLGPCWCRAKWDNR